MKVLWSRFHIVSASAVLLFEDHSPIFLRVHPTNQLSTALFFRTEQLFYAKPLQVVCVS